MKKQKTIAFIVILVALILADTLWFVISLDRLYRPMMGDLLSPAPNLFSALGFYLLYAVGLCYFIVFPRLLDAKTNIAKLICDAALFGLVAFATYDLTALAVIRNFSAKLALIDMAWGMSAAIFSCLFAVLLTKKLAK
jgi:uncharacterized membrane protein